ncbi:MAG: hypothetical protein QNJ97_07575 [Myxococcota bacterium]|nr:hypothetical protein [Myxococcota bacterium]
MAREETTLDLLAHQFGALLQPLVQAGKSPKNAKQFMRDLGFELPPGVNDIGLAALSVSDLIDAIKALRAASAQDLEDELTAAALYAAVLVAAGKLIKDVGDLAANLPTQLAAFPDYLSKTDIANQLAPRVIDLLIVDRLSTELPQVAPLFFLLGIFERGWRDPDPTVYRPGHVRTKIHYDRIPLLFSNPQELLKRAYSWKTGSFDPLALITNIERCIASFGTKTSVRPLPSSIEERFTGTAPPAGSDPVPQLIAGRRMTMNDGVVELGASIMGLRPTSAGGSDGGIGILPVMQGQFDKAIPLPGGGGLLSLLIDSTLSVTGGVALILRGGKPIKVDARLFEGKTEGVLSGRIGTGVGIGRGDEKALRVFALPPGITFDIKKAWVKGGGELGSDGTFDAFVEVGLEGGKVAIGTEGKDSFLSSLIPIESMSVGFDFALGYAPSRGVYFTGSASLETAISLNLDLGPINLDTLHLGLGVSPAALKLETSITGRAALGPFAMSVERIGIETELAFQDGNLGPVDLKTPKFRPPTGLGLVLDAGPVTGGGFLSLDTEKGRYAGVLQLEVLEIAIKAIGLLDTKKEDGSSLPAPGFSFLMIVSAEFQPIQLGYGFTLNGVGGLAGVHRSFDTQALLSGLRNGSLDSIMFPDDPVRNAAQIISNLRIIFPIAVGRYVFGPMAIIGYGTPTLLKGEIGVVIEVPAPLTLAILGQLSAALPDEKAAIIEINLDVVAIIDFGRKLFALDASLRDSRVAAFSIYGDMAMRLSWGSSPSFAFSVGGLNPHFQPPPGFPSLRRVGVALGAGNNPRISLEGYLAVTSNSLQFGARAELYAAAGKFNVKGWLGFDALFIFSPFSFRFDFDAGMALRIGSKRLAGIDIRGTLTGPNPFHAWGKGCIGILFWDICVPFDATFGRRVPEVLPKKNPWAELKAAIEDPRNWSAALPGSVVTAVTVRAPSVEPKPLLVHPMGTAELRQKVVPFNRQLERYGEADIEGSTRYDIKEVWVGDEKAKNWSLVRDFFSPGAVEKLTDAEKISRPSFEKMDAGIRVGSTHVEPGLSKGVLTKVTYETQIVDSPWDSRGAPVFQLSLTVQQAKVAVGAKAMSSLGDTGRRKYGDGFGDRPAFDVGDEMYVIANAQDLVERSEFGRAHSLSEAKQILDSHLAKHPEDWDQLQVVLSHEAERAA